MKKALYSFAAAAMCALLLGSCVKDKGNYDYHAVDSPVWDSGMKTTFNVMSGEDVDITPTFTHKQPDQAATYTYLWYRWIVADRYEPLPEQTESTLHLKGIVKTDEYLLVVRNNTTGVLYKYGTHFVVNVANTLGKGWIYLVQKGADVELEMMGAPFTDYEPRWHLHKNLIENTVDKTKQLQYKDRTAVGFISINDHINYLSTMPYGFLKNTMFMATDKSAEKVTPTTFESGGAMKNYVASYSHYLGDGDVVPTRMMSAGTAGAQYNDFVSAFYWNGNWFFNNIFTRWGGTPFENAVNIAPVDYMAPVGKEIAVTEQAALLRGAHSLVMWSKDRQQFLIKPGFTSASPGNNYQNYLSAKWLTDETQNLDEIKIGTDASSMDFKVQVAGRELKHLSAFSDIGVLGNGFFAIVKDPGDIYKFIRIIVGVGSATRGPAFTFPSSSHIAEAKWYATYSDYLYYATEAGKIYAFSLDGSASEFEVIPTATSTTTMVPAGHELVMFKSFNSQYTDSAIHIITRDPSKPENERCTHTLWDRLAADHRQLYIRTYEEASMANASDPDKVIPENQRNKSVPMQFTGLGDVVDFALDDRSEL